MRFQLSIFHVKSSREELLFLAASFWLETHPHTLEDAMGAPSLPGPFICGDPRSPCRDGAGVCLDSTLPLQARLGGTLSWHRRGEAAGRPSHSWGSRAAELRSPLSLYGPELRERSRLRPVSGRAQLPGQGRAGTPEAGYIASGRDFGVVSRGRWLPWLPRPLPKGQSAFPPGPTGL